MGQNDSAVLALLNPFTLYVINVSAFTSKGEGSHASVEILTDEGREYTLVFYINTFVVSSNCIVRVHRLAGDSKPRGAVVKAGSGAWPSQWAICLWLAGGQLSKVGGSLGGCLVLTPPLSNRLLAFQRQIISLLIVLVFVQLFKLV